MGRLVRPSKPSPPVWGSGGKKPPPGNKPVPFAAKPRPANVSPVASFTTAGNKLAGQALGPRKGTFNSGEVKSLQNKLNARGFKLMTDGDFGDKTKGALKSFQRTNGLNATGILDANTKSKLGMTGKGKKKGLNPAPNFQAAANAMLNRGRTLAKTR